MIAHGPYTPLPQGTPAPRSVIDVMYRNQINAAQARELIRYWILEYYQGPASPRTIYEEIAGYLKGTVQDAVAAVRWAARDR